MEPRLRVGIVAPPLPSVRHEGLELALDSLARGLHDRGHEVDVLTLVDPTTSSDVGSAARGLHRAAGYKGELGECDIVHDHTLASLFLRNLHHRVPVVTTNHGLSCDDPISMYRRHPEDHVPMIAVSADQAMDAPDSVVVSAVIPDSVDLDLHPFRSRSGGYLLAVGAMELEGGIETAVTAARAVDLPLRIYAPTRTPVEWAYCERVVRPQLRPTDELLDELPLRDRIDLLGGATALLHLSRRRRPFCYVMVEAMACGTPVVAWNTGAAAEIVDEAQTGFLVDSPERAIRALTEIEDVSRARCREHVQRSFSGQEVARRHEEFYRHVIDWRAAALADEVAEIASSVNGQDPDQNWHSAYF